MPRHLRIHPERVTKSATALHGHPGMDAFVALGQLTVYFEMKYSEPTNQTSSTVISVDADVAKKSTLLTEQITQYTKLQDAERSETTQTEPAPYACCLIVHCDKNSSYDEDLSSAHKKQPSDLKYRRTPHCHTHAATHTHTHSRPTVRYSQSSFSTKMTCKKGMVPSTFKNLCSFVLTQSGRNYQSLSE